MFPLMKNSILSLLLILLGYGSGNAQWQVVDSLITGSVNCIEFLNVDTGFVYSEWASMRKTEDGTQTWDSSTTAFTSFVYDLDFVNANTGYAVGGAWFPFGNYCANSIMKTVDGGATWDSVYGDYNYGAFTCIDAISPNEFFAVGESWACHSSDGGATLDTFTVSQAVSERYLKVSFLTPQHGYLLSQIYIQTQTSSYQLYETTDGGVSWQMMYSDTLQYPGFLDFVFNNSGDGILVGEKGQIRISKGSNSWTSVTLKDTALWLHKVTMADGRIYAIGSKSGTVTLNGIYSSIDFGLSWQQEQVDLDTNDYITDMSFPGNGVGYFSTYRKLYKNSALISIMEETGLLRLDVFPNPTSSKVNIHLPERVSVSIKLTDVSGRVVKQMELSLVSSFEINLDSESPGVYFLNVNAEGENAIVKFLKN